MTPLRELIRKVADELRLDLRDPFTKVLATAMAASDMEAERRAECHAQNSNVEKP